MADTVEVVPKKNKPVWLIIVILLIVVGVGMFAFIQYKKAQTLTDNPSQAEKLEVQALVTKVSAFISLPEEEVPTVATVSDYTKLQDQQFFTKSQNGDKVLLYTRAKKAYLYRPSTNKLIDVTIININSNPGEPSATPTPSPEPKETK